jgi:hypothetical protein
MGPNNYRAVINTAKKGDALRRSFILLAAGGALLVAGFIIIIASAISIIQAGDENTFFLALMDINPLGQESIDFDIDDASQPFYISTSRDENRLFPPAVMVEGRVVDPAGETILSDGDLLQGFTKVEPTIAGTYTLYLTNTHSSEGVRLLITLTHGFVPETEAEAASIAAGALAGTSIMIASGFVIVVGAALFFNERRKSKNKGSSIVT